MADDGLKRGKNNMKLQHQITPSHLHVFKGVKKTISSVNFNKKVCMYVCLRVCNVVYMEVCICFSFLLISLVTTRKKGTNLHFWKVL